MKNIYLFTSRSASRVSLSTFRRKPPVTSRRIVVPISPLHPSCCTTCSASCNFPSSSPNPTTCKTLFLANVPDFAPFLITAQTMRRLPVDVRYALIYQHSKSAPVGGSRGRRTRGHCRLNGGTLRCLSIADVRGPQPAHPVRMYEISTGAVPVSCIIKKTSIADWKHAGT